MYRSGDRVRHRREGALDFLGRRDHQVKLRGFRIELGEIEAVLSQHPEVRQAVAAVHAPAAASPGQETLVAYVVPETGSEARLVPRLRDFLAARLPQPSRPASWTVLAELPSLPNGKVDRRALPAPDELRPELEATFVAPRTELEQSLARIWTEVLEIGEIGVHDNFFDLGGHSLLATQIVSRWRRRTLSGADAEDRLPADLSLRALFEYPTIAGLAEEISHAAKPGSPASEPDADGFEDLRI